ncbi:MAG TPA: phosphotransferase [Acidimicrobiia bacterium]|nr:phosphotransferase [Acidimicrobiia bacterium]
MAGAGADVDSGIGRPGVDPRHLDQLLLQIEWARGQTCQLVDTWQSPKATLSRYRNGATNRTFIVKAGSNWGTQDAERVFNELRRVRGLLQPLGVVVPEPFGFINDPALVAMEDVGGVSLIKRVLPKRQYLDWPDGKAKLDELLSLCGRALARYHAAEPSPQTDRVQAAVEADIRRAALRGLISPTKANASLRGLPVARGFRFSANDFLTDGNRLVMLDPPHLLHFDLIHRDLSSFTFEVERTFRVFAKEWDFRHTNESVRDSFAEGYGRELAAIAGWDWNPEPGRGSWALSFYELSRIAGMALNQVRAGRLGQGRLGLVWAWERRRQVRSGIAA